MGKPETRAFTLNLTRDELTILRYVLSISDGSNGDPLRNSYELQDEEPEDVYATVKDLGRKVIKLHWSE